MEHRQAIVYDPGSTVTRQPDFVKNTPFMCRPILIAALLFATGSMPAAAQESLPASLADEPLYHVVDGLLMRSLNGGGQWSVVPGLPVRSAPARVANTPQPLTAFTTDAVDSRHVLAAVGRRLFRSRSAGDTWEEVELAGTVNQSTYITSLAIDPNNPEGWALGTSYDGIYLTTDGGETWVERWAAPNRGPYYRGAGFYEEIAALEFEQDDSLLIQAGFGSGFAVMDVSTGQTRRLRPVSDGDLAYRAPNGPARVLPSTRAEQKRESDVSSASRRAAAKARTGIYVAAANASRDRLPGYFDLIEREGYNSIIVDFKDDVGQVTYETELEMPRNAGAVQPLVDVPLLIEEAHRRGIYVIARIVLFKDRTLFRFENSRLALWDAARNAPWGVFRTIQDEDTGQSRVVQVEHWVDPNSAEVRNYNLSIAEEVATLGADEIQFDYVRFPSDGNTASIVSRFAENGFDRVEVLETFLAEARDRIDIPIGIDVFGFNAWSRMSYLGQDIDRLSNYVDVISPMFYPSHFARGFLPALSYFERSRVIYDAGTRRAREIGRGVLIRPYIQAFLIGPELEYEQDEYFRYLELQVAGSRAADSDGYTLWNASGRYYMLR